MRLPSADDINLRAGVLRLILCFVFIYFIVKAMIAVGLPLSHVCAVILPLALELTHQATESSSYW